MLRSQAGTTLPSVCGAEIKPGLQASILPTELHLQPYHKPQRVKMLILNSVSGSGVWRASGSEELLEAPRKDVMVQDTAFGVTHTRMLWCSPVVRLDGGHSECLGCKWLWSLSLTMSVMEQALFHGLGSIWLKSWWTEVELHRPGA